MFSKIEKNYYIDVALTIVSVVCIITGIFLIAEETFSNILLYIKKLHTITGIAMTILIIIHFAMHLKWVTSLTKKIVSDKKKLIVLIVTVILSISICFAVIVSSHIIGGKVDTIFP